jgi:hypothetical protein
MLSLLSKESTKDNCLDLKEGASEVDGALSGPSTDCSWHLETETRDSVVLGWRIARRRRFFMRRPQQGLLARVQIALTFKPPSGEEVVLTSQYTDNLRWWCEEEEEKKVVGYGALDNVKQSYVEKTVRAEPLSGAKRDTPVDQHPSRYATQPVEAGRALAEMETLFTAIRSLEADSVDQYLMSLPSHSDRESILLCRDTWGDTPLLAAVRRMLISCPHLGDGIMHREDGKVAAVYVHPNVLEAGLEVVRVLLSSGIDPAQASARRQTPLHLAAGAGHLHLVSERLGLALCFVLSMIFIFIFH